MHWLWTSQETDLNRQRVSIPYYIAYFEYGIFHWTERREEWTTGRLGPIRPLDRGRDEKKSSPLSWAGAGPVKHPLACTPFSDSKKEVKSQGTLVTIYLRQSL